MHLHTKRDFRFAQYFPLKSWENRGLKRLEPPIEGTRTVYYHIDTVLEFLSHN